MLLCSGTATVWDRLGSGWRIGGYGEMVLMTKYSDIWLVTGG